MASGARPEPVGRIALDTPAYSRFRAGDERVHELIASAEAVLVPATVLGELYGAFEMGSRSRPSAATRRWAERTVSRACAWCCREIADGEPIIGLFTTFRGPRKRRRRGWISVDRARRRRDRLQGLQ